jgi:hypothetical protein
MLRDLIGKLTGAFAAPEQRDTGEVFGIPVVIDNSRPDISTGDVWSRLERCLRLIDQYVPHHFRHLRRDFKVIVVQRFACRGAYFHEQHACLVELTFTVNPEFSDAEVAATILHEAMHRQAASARLSARDARPGAPGKILSTSGD